MNPFLSPRRAHSASLRLMTPHDLIGKHHSSVKLPIFFHLLGGPFLHLYQAAIAAKATAEPTTTEVAVNLDKLIVIQYNGRPTKTCTGYLSMVVDEFSLLRTNLKMGLADNSRR
jgi:hypothetical protein